MIQVAIVCVLMCFLNVSINKKPAFFSYVVIYEKAAACQKLFLTTVYLTGQFLLQGLMKR
jgi:hypothetical protein